MRAVAACSVVFTHIFGTKFPILGSAGNFGVDIFFVLSGFLMSITYKENRTGFSFLKNRVLRIYPAYILISLPLILWEAHKDLHNASYNLLHNITLLPTIYGNYTRYNIVCWTLTYEMYFYIAMAVTMYFFKGSKRVIYSTVSIMLLIFIFSHGFYNGPSGWADNSIHNLVSNYLIIDFIFGALIGLYYTGDNKKKYNLATALCFFIFLSVSYILTTMQPDPTGDKYQIFTFLTSGIPAAIIITLALRMKISSIPFIKSIIYIGNASYSIYLTHFYIRLASLKFNFPGYIIKPASYILAIIVGCLAYELIEKRLNNTIYKNRTIKN